MKILIVHQFLWAHYKAKIYSELYKVVQQDANIELLVLQTALNEKTRAKLGDIDWSLHQYPVELLFNDYYENLGFFERLNKVVKHINSYKPDVINLPGYYEPAMVAVQIYCLLKGIKVILSNDSSENDNPNISWKEGIKKCIIKSAHGFFCYGTRSAEYMLKLGAKPHQILVSNNAVDNDSIAQIHEVAKTNRGAEKEKLGLKKYNFVYAGRFIKFKNLSRLLRAFKALNNPDWGLVLIGEGEEKAELDRLVSKYAIDGVQFLGGKHWFEVPKYFALCDVFVLPSFSEPWGLVLNEAMACGMPIIVSETTGSAVDLVKKNGYTFNPYSEQDLLAKMLRYTDNPDRIKNHGKNSLDIIKRFSPQNVAKEMYDGFVSVMR